MCLSCICFCIYICARILLTSWALRLLSAGPKAAAALPAMQTRWAAHNFAFIFYSTCNTVIFVILLVWYLYLYLGGIVSSIFTSLHYLQCTHNSALHIELVWVIACSLRVQPSLWTHHAILCLASQLGHLNIANCKKNSNVNITSTSLHRKSIEP